MSAAVMAEKTLVAEKKYLIWESGFLPRFAGTAIFLAVVLLGASRSTTIWVHSLGVQSRVFFMLQTVAHRLEMWSLLGLLSSSCCALQLVLNAFSFGCAGFNTVLGPLRPYLVAVTLLFQACVWHAALTGRGPHIVASAVGGTILCLVLTLLPEGLELYVRGRGQRRAGATLEVAATPLEEEVCLKVAGMGCTACTVKVQAALEQVDGVAACSVNLDKGEATLRLADAGTQAAAVERSAVDAILKAGFRVGEAP